MWFELTSIVLRSLHFIRVWFFVVLECVECEKKMEFFECCDSPYILLIQRPVFAGTGDDCSVSSDISERTGILDDECEKSPRHRVSTISVVSMLAYMYYVLWYLIARAGARVARIIIIR